MHAGALSDALLQARKGVGFDDNLDRLGFDRAHAAEDFLLVSLGGQLQDPLEHEEAREGELACGGELSGADLGKAADALGHLSLLEAVFAGHCFNVSDLPTTATPPEER